MLPNHKHPTTNITLPISKKQITIRPFTVKEEKILLIANESQEVVEIIQAVSNVLRNCVVAPLEFDPDSLWMLDYYFIFMHLRMFSISGKAQIAFVEPETKAQYVVNVDIKDILDYNTEMYKDFSDIVKVSDTMSIKFKPITSAMFAELQANQSTDKITSVIASMFDKIYVENEDPIDVSLEPLEQVVNWIEGFRRAESQALGKYISEIPNLRYPVTYKDSEGEEREVVLNNVQSFFT